MKYWHLALCLTLLLTWVSSVTASSVTIDEVEIAANVWTTYRLESWAASAGYNLAEVEPYPDANDPLCFLAHLEPSGFIILSTDNLIEPIIAFSATGNLALQDLDNPLWSLVLEDLAVRQAALEQTPSTRTATQRQTLSTTNHQASSRWTQLLNTPLPEETTNGRTFKVTTSLSTVSDIRVDPLIQTQWGQSQECSLDCYNYYTPNHYVCGCAATALAQLMYYHRHPSQGIGLLDCGVTVDGVSQTLTTVGGDEAGGAYLWSQMKKNPDSSCSSLTEVNRQAIGALCYDAALVIETDFTEYSSGAYTDKLAPALTDVFDYAGAVYGYVSSWDKAAFNQAVNPNLDAERPVLLGIKNSSSGHAVVADGYGYDDSTLYHHLNMGWRGSCDLWYNLPTVDDGGYNFTAVSCTIYNVSPSTSRELISGRVLDASGQPLEDAQITASWSGSSASDTCNDQGIFWFAVPSNTEVTLEASATDYNSDILTVTTGRSRDGLANSGNVWACDFSLTATTPDTVDLTIASGSGGTVITPGEGTFSYAVGTLVTLTATADDHYSFENWTGSVADTLSASTTLTVTEETSVTANFALDQHQVTITSTSGGSTNQDGTQTLNYGDSLILTATAEDSYQFTGWSGDATGSDNPLTVTVTSDLDITANFTSEAIEQYQVTVTSTTGGHTDQDGSQSLNAGSSLILTATAQSGYQFTGWSGDAAGSDNPLTVTLTSDLNITANFALKQYLVTVTSGPGGSTDQDGTQTLDHGVPLTLAATAQSGYQFTGWGGDATGSDNPLTVTVTSDLDITANFTATQQQVILNLKSQDGGSVTSPGEGIFTYPLGTEIPLEATAQSGYCFSHWSGNLYSRNSTCTLTLSGDMTITANFEPLTYYRLDTQSTAGGTLVQPSDTSGDYLEGTVVTLEVHPIDPDRFVFLGWQGSAVEAGLVDDPTALLTTLTVNVDCLVQARFLSLLDTLYVDDDAPNDPGPGDLDISDPAENGTVNHPLDSIQEAIEVADDTTRIWITPGSYQETLNFQGKTLDVNGLALCGLQAYPIIDAQQTGVVVTFNQTEGRETSLSGLVLTGGLGTQAGAILCDGASPTIRHCLMVGNYCDDPNGAVVYCRDSNSLFDQCTLSDNAIPSSGSTFRLIDCNAVITDSILWDLGSPPFEVPSGNLPQVTYSTLTQDWGGVGNLNLDPTFVLNGSWLDLDDPTSYLPGDYHLASQAGHWDIDLLQWILDEVTSPCIDAGDPNVLPIEEPAFNGGLVNQGAYGRTSQASRTQEQ